MGGSSTDIDFMNLSNRPQGLDDGDDNTQLSQTEVLDYVNGSPTLALVHKSMGQTSSRWYIGGALPSDLADGDNDPWLDWLRMNHFLGWPTLGLCLRQHLVLRYRRHAANHQSI